MLCDGAANTKKMEWYYVLIIIFGLLVIGCIGFYALRRRERVRDELQVRFHDESARIEQADYTEHRQQPLFITYVNEEIPLIPHRNESTNLWVPNEPSFSSNPNGLLHPATFNPESNEEPIEETKNEPDDSIYLRKRYLNPSFFGDDDSPLKRAHVTRNNNRWRFMEKVESSRKTKRGYKTQLPSFPLLQKTHLDRNN